jgi:hypothetical protein
MTGRRKITVKEKSKSTNNNNKEDISTKTITSVPSLKDMEFNWIKDY